MKLTEIERLKDIKDSAFREWQKLQDPANAAYKKFQTADKAHKDAVLYEKAKRQVIRELIKTAAENDTSHSN